MTLDKAATIQPKVFFENLMQFRRDIVESVPENARVKPMSDPSGRTLEQFHQTAQEMGLDYQQSQFRFSGRFLPSFADGFLMCGQMLASLKRKHPELFV